MFGSTSRGFTDAFFGFRVGLLQAVFQHISGELHEHPQLILKSFGHAWNFGDALEPGLTMLPSIQHRP